MSQIKTICSLGELKKLEVINVCNGRRLGCINDVELDLCLGVVVAILLPKRLEWQTLFIADESKRIRIPWRDIERIGDDTILVRLLEDPK